MATRKRAPGRRRTSPRRNPSSKHPELEIPKDKLPSLDPLFRPRSVAVVGASRNPTSIGREILANLVDFNFQGPVYPVNPKTKVVHSMKCWPRVRDIPDKVDLAILVVPARRILAAVDDCGKAGVKALVVITAGFKEIGDEGAKLEQELLRKVRRYKMRMVGPNCMGMVNAAPDVRLNASFAQARPEPGSVGFITQSGALGEVILANARDIHLGLARFVSVGNKADVSGNDLLFHWADDPDVQLILMYLESFGKPVRFTEVVRRISRKKPILAVKSGRTAAGARAAFSHTGALSGLDVAVDTLFDQCGIIRARSMEELFTLAPAFATQPVPKGNRVAVLTNAGGPGILAVDACVSSGLEVAPLEKRTIERLRKVVPAECSVQNPVDLIASADAERYNLALDALSRDKNIDAFLVIFVSPVLINAYDVASRIVETARKIKKPMLTCIMGKQAGHEAVEHLRGSGVPVYPFPEAAAQALAALYRYRCMLDRPEPRPERFRVNRRDAERILEGALREKRAQLYPEEAEALLKAYGIPFAPARFTSTRAEAIDAGHTLGYPVVLKAVAPGLVHKSDVGGVEADIRNADELAHAYDRIRKNVGRRAGLRIQVQPMVQGGQEVILGSFHDPKFGPLLMFGLGGIYVEYLKDVTFGLHPLHRGSAREMIQSIRGRALLEGARGNPPVDLEILENSLLRLSKLMGDFPQLDQVDINPFIACPAGKPSLAVDARAKLRLEG
jgi:acetyltransferase